MPELDRAAPACPSAGAFRLYHTIDIIAFVGATYRSIIVDNAPTQAGFALSAHYAEVSPERPLPTRIFSIQLAKIGAKWMGLIGPEPNCDVAAYGEMGGFFTKRGDAKKGDLLRKDLIIKLVKDRKCLIV